MACSISSDTVQSRRKKANDRDTGTKNMLPGRKKVVFAKRKLFKIILVA